MAPLRLVHLEDDPNDRALVADVLRADGIVCTVVWTFSRETFEAALQDPPDAILADFSLPGFDGISAQEIAHARCPDVPFIFVSGSIGEERAVERLRHGATDYVLKQRLEKLPSAVRRAVREAEDRHQRSLAEQALQQLNAELQARVNERTQQVTAAKEALEQAWRDLDRASRAKSEFLSRMSHDLRTPLNAIMGFAQLLELDALTPSQQESVAQIIRGGRHLLELINEVLDIARIEAGRLSVSPEPVNTADIIRHAVELIQPLAAARRIRVHLHTPPDVHVLADRQRLNQILFNLLSNAVKYNREGGTIRVSVRSEEDRVAIVVADTGAGIPPAKMGLVFTPFERLGAEQTGVEGTGLGLALSKGLAEAMQGSLTVESVVDAGSAFCLELPATAAVRTRHDKRRPADTADTDSAGTILYVEDNLPNVLLMERLLARRPRVRLVHAAGGGKALQMIREARPDLVFLDAHLPDVPGEDVLRHIWENPETRSIPVAVLSADATPSKMQRMLASGAIAYLTKPLDVAEVFRLIDRVLGSAGREVVEP